MVQSKSCYAWAKDTNATRLKNSRKRTKEDNFYSSRLKLMQNHHKNRSTFPLANLTSSTSLSAIMVGGVLTRTT